jgi:hypothetical protein
VKFCNIKRLLVFVIFVLFVAGCADAGKDQRVVSGEQVVLDGSGSTPNIGGKIRRYRWKQLSGPTVRLFAQKSPQASFVAPDVSHETVLRFRLTTHERRKTPTFRLRQ